MWMIVLENLIPLLFTIISPPLVALAGWGLQKLAKKWKMEEALKYEDKVDDLVLKAIKAMEKKSLNAVKRGGERTPGQKKLEGAMKFVNNQLRSLKLPQKAADELVDLIEAQLYDGAKARPEEKAAA